MLVDGCRLLLEVRWLLVERWCRLFVRRWLRHVVVRKSVVTGADVSDRVGYMQF